MKGVEVKVVFHVADLDEDGVIDLSEVMVFIEVWKGSDEVSVLDVLEVVGIWLRG